MNGVQGGLLMIGAAIVLYVLWTQGYLAKYTSSLTGSLSGSPASKALKFSVAPAQPTGQTGLGSTAQPV